MKQVTSLMGGEGLRGELLQGGAGSLTVKSLSTGLAFGVAVVLARALGAEGYGIYAYVIALITVLAVPAKFGLPHLVVRETAKSQVEEAWGNMRGVWRWANAATGTLSLIIAVVAGGVAWSFSGYFTDNQLATFAWSLLLVPLIALGNLRGAALRGLRQVVVGQLPETVLRPTMLILLTLAVITLFPAEEFTADNAMMLHVVAAGGAFTIGTWLLWRARPEPLKRRPPPVYASKAWIKATLPLGFLAAMQLINKYTDTLMLGIFRSAEDVGVYYIVMKGATLVVFGQQATSMVLAPHFARLHTAGESSRLQRLITMSVRANLVMALPVVVLFAVFGREILGFMFGAEYRVGYIALIILSVGQFVNAPLGQVAHLLNMTGHEGATARGMAVAAVGNVLLNLILIPPLGMEGAALAAAITLILWNVLLWRQAFRLLNVVPHRMFQRL